MIKEKRFSIDAGMVAQHYNAECPQNGQTHVYNFAANTANFLHAFDHFVDTMDYRVNQFKHIAKDFA